MHHQLPQVQQQKHHCSTRMNEIDIVKRCKVKSKENDHNDKMKNFLRTNE